MAYEGKMKAPRISALFLLGCLFFVQSAIIAAQFRWKTVSPKIDSLLGSLFGCAGCWLWAWYLSSKPHRKRSLKMALISLVVAYASGGLAFSAIEFFHNQRVEGQARQLFAHAQEDAKPTWNEDDATRWFHDHNILDARRGVGAHETKRESEQYYCVAGFQQIEEGGLVFRPASVEIEFVFGNLDHRFERVQYHIWPFKAKELR